MSAVRRLWSVTAGDKDALPPFSTALACWKDVWILALEPLAPISFPLGIASRTIVEKIPRPKEKVSLE